MAESWGVWAQVDMAATTDTTVYTIPASTDLIAKVRITNRTGAGITIRLWVDVGGGGDLDEQYFLYDYSLPANDAITVLLAATATDLIRGRASATGTSWNVYGVQLT